MCSGHYLPHLPTVNTANTFDPLSNYIFLVFIHIWHHIKQKPQADPEITPRPNSKQKPMPKFKTCRDNLAQMLKRRWMFFCQSAVRLVWRFLRQGSVLRKRFMENKCVWFLYLETLLDLEKVQGRGGGRVRSKGDLERGTMCELIRTHHNLLPLVVDVMNQWREQW